MMRRNFWVVLATLLLFSPSLGSANPSGVGEGAFDAQCGGACHGDADMNRSSSSIVTLHSEAVAYEGLLTSVTVSIDNIETTQQGLLGVFLLSSLDSSSLSLLIKFLFENLFLLHLVDGFDKNGLVFELVTLSSKVEVMINIGGDLLGLSIFSKESSKNSLSSHVQDLSWHSSVSGTLSFTETIVSS